MLKRVPHFAPQGGSEEQALSAYVQAQTATLRRRLGRPLRVLHIGNIANNAYVNAKIMRRIGIEADVLVLDYYHVMGCPEWEEGAIVRLEGTTDQPDWHKSVVSGFVRPRWFVQGPGVLCYRYLSAENPFARRLHWSLLSWHLKLSGAQSGPRRYMYLLSHKIAGLPSGLFRHWWHAFAWKVRSLTYRLIHLTMLVLKIALILVGGMSVAVIRDLRRLFGMRHRSPKAHGSIGPSRLGVLLNLSNQLLASVFALIAGLLVAFVRDIRRVVGGRRELSAVRGYSREEAVSLQSNREQEGQNTLPPLETQSPHAASKSRVVTVEDQAAYRTRALRFKPVFDRYDIVQAYSIDGILPLLAGKKNFTCYEHGTLRDIPFQDTPMGRNCAFTYLNAPAVFITNTDCIAAADKLGVPKERQHPLPHAFDSQRVLEFRRANAAAFVPRNDPVTFIAPARHHWKVANMVSWLKGNDVAIRAARLLADQGLNFKIIFVRWGQEIAESERLIEELGVGAYFEWVDPLPKQRLWQYYMSCNGVFDQFVIPAIGSVSFETLAFGRPLFTRIDEPVFADFFGEAPPLFNVCTPEGLAAAAAPLIRDPAAYRAVEDDANRWVAQYHSSDRILQIQLAVYQDLLNCADEPQALASMDLGIAMGADPLGRTV